MKKSIPTIRDVAAAAGVSTATVSKYVNGAQRFSPAVEATIKKVIEELGYRSNPLAQSMITGRTKTIGLSVLDISNPHFTSIVKGANRVAIEHGYTLLLVDTDENAARERSLLEALSRRVDGMLVFSRMPEQEMEWMMDLQKPLVFFGRLAHLKLPSVGSDDRRGAYMVTQHLVALGHKHIAYMGFSRSRRDEERMTGILDCLTSHQLDLVSYDCDAPSSDARVLAVLSVWTASAELVPITLARLAHVMPDWQTASGSLPLFFNVAREQGSITVYPRPANAQGALITLQARYAPKRTATTLPAFLADRYEDALLHGAKARLMLQVNVPWSHPAAGQMHQQAYEDALAQATVDQLHEQVTSTLRVRPVRFG